ncbi:flagellar assembly peptidoglycan hydrolase FlgJ [Aestuariibacter salexigens]|uniref:flagellar assembly peptidoglycan hydrolase FlgJ n=1 Tax=Aestuariibacter salexigens TaxID=226010 RepID=UPI0003F91B32|nr:flagellar assembly peptidoglycan hydrolase FlgJ [Aestuariibacter salexigens]
MDSDLQSGHIKSQLEMTRNYHDLGSVDKLRQAALSGDKGALREAAQQFEAVFVNMLLKSMRKAQDALADEDSPFNSEQVKFYRDMHDQQLATDLSSKGSLGLADIIVQQLSHDKDGYLPATAIRNDANLADIRHRRTELSPLDGVERQIQRSKTVTQPGIKQAAFEEPQHFVNALYPIAEKVGQQYGLDAKAMIAQAAVETGWGRYLIHDGQGNNSHNLFGIKADNRWQGEKVVVDTLEYQGGIANRQRAPFRAYGSFLESMRDYAQFITGSQRYEQALENAGDAQKYVESLQQAGYATDPNYASKIKTILNGALMRGLTE